jgi:hypothetical protein
MAMVEIRMFREADSVDDWQSVPIAAYLPVMLSGDHFVNNIEKRIRVNFLKRDPSILRIRWAIKDEVGEGYWIEA